MRELWRRLLWLRNRARFERELDEELRHHLALKAEEQGPVNAPRAFGNVVLLKEEIRSVWAFTYWEQLAKDVRYGMRAMTANKLFTALAVLSLALGIGANTAIYSFLDAVMIRDLPVERPEELAIVNWRARADPPVVTDHNGSDYDEPGGGTTSPDFPWPAYEDLRDHNSAFSALFAHKSEGGLTLMVRGQAETGRVELVSANYFSGLGVRAAFGRLLSDEESRPGAAPAAVLSFDYWRERFAGNPAAIGATIGINNLPFTVIGVAAPGFFGVRASDGPAVFIAMANRPALVRSTDDRQDMFTGRHFYWVEAMGRLRPGVTLARAQAELAARFQQFELSTASTEKERANLPRLWLQEGASGVDTLRREFSTPLLVLMTMVVLILAIACANIANLLLARASARRREIAVRLSMGASRSRVLRQLLTESLLLALPGALAGIGIAELGIRFLTWLISSGREGFYLRAELNWRVLAFTLAVALGTGILFGLAPALQAIRVNISPALKETRASTPRSRWRGPGLSQILLVAQISMALFLAAGASLFVRSLRNLHSVQLGFDADNLLVFNIDATQAGYKEAALTNLYTRLAARFKSLPGVRESTMTGMPLVSGWTSSVGIRLPGRPDVPGRRGPGTAFTEVGPTFFGTMKVPILLGRAIDERDSAGAPLSVVVNEVFAQKYFPGQNPIGLHFSLGSRKSSAQLTIVGVAKAARYSSLRGDIPPVTYVPYLQNVLDGPPPQMFFELRTAGDPLALAPSIRGVVHEEAPNVPVRGIHTEARGIDNTITHERVFAQLCTVFAALALAIASVGLYGSLAYAVSRRTNEIGIRIALGAERARIAGMIVREICVLIAVGVGLGLLAVRLAGPVVESMLFGLKPADPASLALSIAVLAIAALGGGYAPSMRASRIDPMAALRHE